jgi:arsenite oxidase small subunit
MLHKCDSISNLPGHYATVLPEAPKIWGKEETPMKRCDAIVDAGRRSFFARTAAVAAGAAAATTVPGAPAGAAPALALVDYPSRTLANIKDLKVNEPFDVAYPDADSPGVLLKLGTRVEGGAGPDGDVIAFSTLCPHKGYPLNYVAADRTLNCPGHYSRFDCEKGGLEIWGHATQNLAQFRLRVDQAGDIHAEAVDELIYGRLSNVLQG